ncbi:MAG: nuclear transport factor 2 family protein [Planctomycetes bacterium]|nr:nuclear transport factor 2 family protein [Planctomycetota bacterium]
MSESGAVPKVVELSNLQLAAYNRADIDAFCACYSEDIRVLDAEGNTTLQGMAAFRERYGKMFATMQGIRAEIIGRMTMGNHVVEHELWQRHDPTSGETQSGEVIVRYTEIDGKLAIAQFLH